MHLSMIISTTLRSALVLVCLSVSSMACSQEARDGEVRKTNQYEVWSTQASAWVTPLAFWQSYAQQNGGLTWGTRSTYPEYAKVKEHDLMIIEVATGPCLMEFFHTRWRRANDVRRWDPKFNELGGCPNVFD